MAVGSVTRLPSDVAVPFWHLCEVEYDQTCFVPCHLEQQNDYVGVLAEYAYPDVTSFHAAVRTVGDLPRYHALQILNVIDEWFSH